MLSVVVLRFSQARGESSHHVLRRGHGAVSRKGRKRAKEAEGQGQGLQGIPGALISHLTYL